MKQKIKPYLLTVASITMLMLFLAACNNKTELKLVEWQEVKMYQLPQQVIDFYYNADTNASKFIVVLDSNYKADQQFIKTSNLAETHYSILINHNRLNIRERDFRAPFLIYDGKLYYSKSLILKGKLMTPQDLFIYSVDLKTVLK